VWESAAAAIFGGRLRCCTPPVATTPTVHRPSGKTATTLLQVRSLLFSFSFLTRGSGGGVGEKPRHRWRGKFGGGGSGRRGRLAVAGAGGRQHRAGRVRLLCHAEVEISLPPWPTYSPTPSSSQVSSFPAQFVTVPAPFSRSAADSASLAFFFLFALCFVLLHAAPACPAGHLASFCGEILFPIPLLLLFLQDLELTCRYWSTSSPMNRRSLILFASCNLCSVFSSKLNSD